MLKEGRIPKAILTDQGLEFANATFEKIAKMSNIKLIRTKGYHSRMNGAIERFNRTIQTVLKKITIIPTEWDEKLQYAVFAYNSCRHEATGESPHYLMYGRDARVPMKSDPEERIGNYQTDLDDYKKEQKSAKRWFDEKHRVVSRKYPVVGDRVLMKIPAEKLGARNPKLTNEWKGPYRVVRTTENSAELQIIGGNEKLWVPWEQIRKVPKEVPEVNFETKAGRGKRGRRKTSEKLGKTIENVEISVDNIVSYRNVIVEGCECPNGPCQVREGSAVITSVEELAMKIFAREKTWPQEDHHLLIHAETFKQMLGETEKVEALRKFAKTCPAVAKLVMNEGEIGAKWRTAVNALRNETLERSKPRKTVLKEKGLLVGPKLGIRSRCTLEYRLAAVEDWVDKFDWSNTESVVFLVEWTGDEKLNKPLGELVEKLALEVTDVTIVPSRMLCTFDEVQNVTNYWKKTWRTAANVQLVDPMSLIGEKKTPLILSEWKIGSWDRLMEFLKLAVPTHRIMARLLKEADVAEPNSKKHKLAN
uniref:Integrase n=1 Tax=Caenorhabditis japonica TaxID=281687 RepID=A0A8R1HP30_CAEJA